MSEWLSCERRISKAAGELMPAVLEQQRTDILQRIENDCRLVGTV